MSTNRVYVGNLSYRTTWYELKDYMRTAGNVAHARILANPNGQSRGYGFVEFADVTDAQKAIDELNGTKLMGRTIFVRHDRAPPAARANDDRAADPVTGEVEAEASNLKSSGENLGQTASANPTSSSTASTDGSSGAASITASTTASTAPATSTERPAETTGFNHSAPHASAAKGFALFVGNLPYSVAWPELKQLFQQAGEVVRADVHLGGASPRASRGHGTVVFASAADAAAAIQQFNGYELDGRALEVREDMPVSERPLPFLWCSAFGEESETVHIANLPFSTTESDLVELFQSVGALTRSQLQTFPDGRPSGNGVVRYERLADARRAVEQLNTYNYGSRELQVSFARYPPRS